MKNRVELNNYAIISIIIIALFFVYAFFNKTLNSRPDYTSIISYNPMIEMRNNHINDSSLFEKREESKKDTIIQIVGNKQFQDEKKIDKQLIKIEKIIDFKKIQQNEEAKNSEKKNEEVKSSERNEANSETLSKSDSIKTQEKEDSFRIIKYKRFLFFKLKQK